MNAAVVIDVVDAAEHAEGGAHHTEPSGGRGHVRIERGGALAEHARGAPAGGVVGADQHHAGAVGDIELGARPAIGAVGAGDDECLVLHVPSEVDGRTLGCLHDGGNPFLALELRSAVAQRAPVLDRFEDVACEDALAAGQVGDGARHAQDAVVGAARPVEVFHALLQVGLAVAVELAVVVDFARGHVLVALALALQLDIGRRLHAGGDHPRWFAVGIGRQDLGIDRSDFDLDIDAVQQRAGDAALVTLDDVRRAAADAADVAVVAARAGVHRGDQLEMRGEVGLPRGARNGDAARFQRLAQHVQHIARELGELVEKQHAPVRQRNLARPRHAAAV